MDTSLVVAQDGALGDDGALDGEVQACATTDDGPVRLALALALALACLDDDPEHLALERLGYGLARLALHLLRDGH